MNSDSFMPQIKKTTNWLQTTSIPTIDWPSRSPDLNPIENIWGILAQNVYKNGKQYSKTSRVGPASPVPHLALRVELFIEFLKINPLKA